MRNEFNLSHEHKTSCDMGNLIPVMCEEVLPGDTFIHRATALTRVTPLVHPIMHRCELRMHTFYVPNRILWSGWEDFITGKDTATAKPELTLTGTGEELIDHLGCPPTAGIEFDQMPVQAYNLIYNEFYRDQDLTTPRGLLDTTIANCSWQKDYFTIARPTPQQGDPEGIPVAVGKVPITTDNQTNAVHNLTINTNTAYAGTVVPDHALQADFSAGTAEISIDDLRRSLALQRFAEARMRFGSRYIDYLRYIGVNPSDGRLDRPEYLGGGKQHLSFSEVLATAEGAATDVGEMFGHGIAMGKSNGYRKSFEEHGWVLTLLSVRPKTVYENAVPRKFQRTNAMDYWQKELEVLPWQEVSEQEVHSDGSTSTVWGYVPRFEEYRHGVSTVSGTLRGGTENNWHMARDFATPPALNASFINCDPTERIYQDSNQPDLILNVQHSLRARRFVGAMASMGQTL